MKNPRAFFNLRFEAEKLAAGAPDLKIISQKIAAGVLHGPHATRRAGGGESFWQYREYVSGDTPGSIDWRQSAKGERVFVREKEQFRAQSHLFWIQREPGMDFCSDKNLLSKRQTAQVIALTLALLHARGGEIVGMAGRGGAGHSGRAMQAFETALEENDPAALPASGLRVPADCNLVLIGDFLSPVSDIERSLEPLAHRTRNATILQILDPAEVRLPYKGRIVFERPGHGPEVLINNAGDVAQAYNERIAGHNAQVKALAARLGWNMRLHLTSDDPAVMLAQLWRQFTLANGRTA